MFKIIKSPSNPYIKQLVKLRKDKKVRKEEKKVLITEKNTIKDLVKHFPIEILITTNEELIKDFKAKTTYLVTKDIIKKITNLKSPQELAAIFKIPKLNILKKEKILILDDISDPGNLGTIIRSAVLFDFDMVILTSETTDPFSEKAIRASKGAMFFIPLVSMTKNEINSFLKENKIMAFLADLKGVDISKSKPFKKPLALILSNESKGISDFNFTNLKKIYIPTSNKIDSLNVAQAGSILMYLMRLHG